MEPKLFTPTSPMYHGLRVMQKKQHLRINRFRIMQQTTVHNACFQGASLKTLRNNMVSGVEQVVPINSILRIENTLKIILFQRYLRSLLIRICLMGLQIAQATDDQQLSVIAQCHKVILQNTTNLNKKTIVTIVSIQMTSLIKFQHIHKLRQLNINSLTMTPQQETISLLPGASRKKEIGATSTKLSQLSREVFGLTTHFLQIPNSLLE